MSVQSRTTALQNEIVRLDMTFTRDGRLANPAAQPLVEIIDTDGVTVWGTVQAQMQNTGMWYADWYVPPSLPVGNYYDRWTWQFANVSGPTEQTMTFNVYSLDNYINFISPSIAHSISGRVAQMLKDLANEFIYEAMHIPVYWEQAMRIQQENQQKRVKKYYYFTLASDTYDLSVGDVYFNNNQRFTVFESLTHQQSSSSSESSSTESEGNSSTNSSSSSSLNDTSVSSNSSSESSNTSSSSNTVSSFSSSSSSFIPHTTTTTTTDWRYTPILTCVGTGSPTNSGTLAKVSGTGPDTIIFESYEERTSRFSTVYNLVYQNWNKSPRPIVRVNNRIVDDGWTVDFNGRVFFDGLMAPEDSVNIAYNFAYFSDEELMSFLNLGLQMMNSVPPASVTSNNLLGMPNEWNAPVMLYAAITALKRLIFGLNFQEKMIIFGKPEDARNAIANFQGLYQDYNATWTEIKKDAKTKRLYGISQYVTPEYSLPGGRSRFFRYMYKSN